MPSPFVCIRVWKELKNTEKSDPWVFFNYGIPGKADNDIELMQRQEHISIAFFSESQNEYISFWGTPLLQKDTYGGVMHSLKEDENAMGRKADVTLIIEDLDMDAMMIHAKYLVSMWINHLDTRKASWSREHYKDIKGDHSALNVYQILKIGSNKSNNPIFVSWNEQGQMIVTPSSLYGILNKHTLPNMNIEQELLDENNDISFPKQKLYLKFKDDRMNYNGGSLTYVQKREFGDITCLTEDSKTISFSSIHVVPDLEKIKPKAKIK